MTVFDIALVTGSVVLALLSGYAAALMLYAWEDEEKLSRNSVPASFEPPRRSFTLLLPARHEEVIQDTIQRVVDLNYSPELVQVLIVIEAGDLGTIAQVNEKLAELRAFAPARSLRFSRPTLTLPTSCSRRGSWDVPRAPAPASTGEIHTTSTRRSGRGLRRHSTEMPCLISGIRSDPLLSNPLLGDLRE
jgi:cellulose synthase/poly-beta-1,6-N-acetylglucosamine synthase-like glycosyltransferase